MSGECLMDVADQYGYQLCSDDKWRESCVRCKGRMGNVCDICDGLGYLAGEGCDAFTDEEMWQYIEDRRESVAEDMAAGDRT